MEIKTKWRIAAALSFVVVLLYAKDKSDIYTIGKMIGYAILIATPIIAVVWKYKQKFNNIPKGVSALRGRIYFGIYGKFHDYLRSIFFLMKKI